MESSGSLCKESTVIIYQTGIADSDITASGLVNLSQENEAANLGRCAGVGKGGRGRNVFPTRSHDKLILINERIPP